MKKRISRILAISIMLLLSNLHTQQGFALTDIANELVSKQLNQACERGKGNIDPSALIEMDLTGDGQLDLIIDFSGIQCNTGINSFCGARACSILIYVREDGLLQEVETYLSSSVSLNRNGKKARPVISMWGYNGEPYAVQWKSGKFTPVKPPKQ